MLQRTVVGDYFDGVDVVGGETKGPAHRAHAAAQGVTDDPEIGRGPVQRCQSMWCGLGDHRFPAYPGTSPGAAGGCIHA